MVDYGFALAPGEEAFVGVSPEGMHSDEYVTKIPMEKRGCYTPSERQLAYYHHYSLLNCYMECVSNYTDEVPVLCYFSKVSPTLTPSMF